MAGNLPDAAKTRKGKLRRPYRLNLTKKRCNKKGVKNYFEIFLFYFENEAFVENGTKTNF